jgi:hypothetical protein
MPPANDTSVVELALLTVATICALEMIGLLFQFSGAVNVWIGINGVFGWYLTDSVIEAPPKVPQAIKFHPVFGVAT